jgi:hypothetical protein
MQSEKVQREAGVEHGKLKVVNLFGAPGVGKSASRSGLFWLMKIKGMSVEEVSEFAKYLVLAKRMWQLQSDQLYVLAKQHHKMMILRGAYEFAVTDSPLMLAGYYYEEIARAGSSASPSEDFVPFCLSYSNSFDNLNLFLTRDFRKSAFEEQGRVHGVSDSERIDGEQREFLARNNQPWVDIDLDSLSPYDLLEKMVEQIDIKWSGSVARAQGLSPGSPKKVQEGLYI